jgi:hemolysin III
MRGVVHLWACVVSIGLGVALVASAGSRRAAVASAIYAACVVSLFASSAVYHRVTWRSVAARQRMRRVDHSAIFLLIAGTYTPIAKLALHGTTARVVLIVVWSGAALGILLTLLWITSPRWVTALVYIALGWVAVAATPQVLDALGVTAAGLIATGGVAYTVGAVIYARRRPDPVPAVFGYHEVFHLLVVVAAALHYAVIAFWVVN